ncbi:RHS repeat domain-containing protein [Aquimarina hainanensis]|uniref:RHS repeat domain-containing protein n=1 Tax=Aquimarina hainanensis TaxID=1578017 RepID=A0ABW5N5Z2_9FLAO
MGSCYPFGLEHRGYNNVVNGRAHNWKYNGKEQNKSLGLNVIEMDWRQYDPAIGRFNVIDPLADHPFQSDITPYNFSWNDPIMYNDPSGLCPECPDAKDYKEGDTYDVNGASYVLDNDGQWARQGGSLEEVVINGSSSSGDSNSEENNEAVVTLGASRGQKVLPAIGELSGFSKFSAEFQENILNGRSVNINGITYPVNAAGRINGIGINAATVNIPTGPGVGGSGKLITKFSPEQLLKWWRTSSKTGISAAKAAEKMGGALVKKYKGSVDTGARSGEHGRAFIKAGQELIRQANNKNAGHLPDMIKALKTAGQRLIEKGKSINHKM